MNRMGWLMCLLRVKKGVLVSIRVFSFKRSTTGAFVVMCFRVLIPRLNIVLELVPPRYKKFQATPTKQDLAKFPSSTPVLFIWEP